MNTLYSESEALVNDAQVWIELLDFESALSLINKAIILSPDRASNWIVKSQVLRELGDYLEALTSINRALELENSLCAAILERGIVWRYMRKYDKALHDFDKVLEAESTNFLAYANRGEVNRILKRYQLALQDFNIAIEMKHDHLWSILGRAETYLNLRDYEAAFRDFHRVVSVDVENIWCHYQLSLLYKVKGKQALFEDEIEKAIRLASKQIQQVPTYSYNQFNLALFYAVKGDIVAVRETYQLINSQGISRSHVFETLEDIEQFRELFSDTAPIFELVRLLQSS